MLNAKYVVYNAENPPLVNPNACGAAWFVEKLNVVKNANEEIQALASIDPKMELVVNEKFAGQLVSSSKDSLDKIALTQYAPNHLVYSAKVKTNRTAVFSEIYYKDGWKATIDGKEAAIYRVNYTLRGLEIPKGKHTIEFKFEPEVVKTGSTIALFSSIGMILLIIGGVYFERKKKKD
jgi:uncharacterized membrane protein YfhO